MCMRDSDAYIGGCCGTTGYTQDILNGIFRDSGSVDGKTAWDLIQTGGSHEGHEALTEKDEAKLLEQETKWAELMPHEKVMLCVGAARDKMKFGWLDTPRRTMNPTDPAEVLSTLHRASGYLSYKDLFSNETDWDGKPAPLPIDVRSGQKHGNVALMLARCVPAAKAFLEIATRVEKLPFEGFAVVDDKNEPASNGFGLCLYHTREAGEELLVQWRKSNDERNEQTKTALIDKLTVKKCRVTIENGLEIF